MAAKKSVEKKPVVVSAENQKKLDRLKAVLLELCSLQMDGLFVTWEDENNLIDMFKITPLVWMNAIDGDASTDGSALTVILNSDDFPND